MIMLFICRFHSDWFDVLMVVVSGTRCRVILVDCIEILHIHEVGYDLFAIICDFTSHASSCFRYGPRLILEVIVLGIYP